MEESDANYTEFDQQIQNESNEFQINNFLDNSELSSIEKDSITTVNNLNTPQYI
jgi:hypothetical protein